MQRIDKRLVAAIDRKEKAKANLKEVRKKVQAECKHTRVAETPWRYSEYGSSFNARRICLACGYEEEGSHWSDGPVWSEVDYNPPTLGNKEGRDILIVEDRDAFHRLRIS